MEGLLVNERKLLFKLSKPVVVVYGIESMESNVKEFLGILQKLNSALDVDKKRVRVRVRVRVNVILGIK